jgi:hypothetical protein
MPQWRDVDTIDDLKALFERGRTAGCDESRTMVYLRLHKDRLFRTGSAWT